MPRRLSKTLHYSLILALLLATSLSLSGCDGLDFLGSLFHISKGKEARAQQDIIVESFVIRPGSLRITSRTVLELQTNIVVQEEVTIYKEIDGNMEFFLSSGQRETRALTVDQILIERTGANNLLTWIRN
jgi:hypothetical protein